jgi:hypothetical protein
MDEIARAEVAVSQSFRLTPLNVHIIKDAPAVDKGPSGVIDRQSSKLPEATETPRITA